jgi:toxin ParE1/3/4
MNIKWSKEALQDLQSLHRYIAKDNQVAAEKTAMVVVKAVETILPVNPEIGRPGRVIGTRELVIKSTPYIVPYRIKLGVIQVLRVYHGARKWPDQL